eukprot:6483836-Amphidinium_carterae.1
MQRYALSKTAHQPKPQDVIETQPSCTFNNLSSPSTSAWTILRSVSLFCSSTSQAPCSVWEGPSGRSESTNKRESENISVVVGSWQGFQHILGTLAESLSKDERGNVPVNNRNIRNKNNKGHAGAAEEHCDTVQDHRQQWR